MRSFLGLLAAWQLAVPAGATLTKPIAPPSHPEKSDAAAAVAQTAAAAAGSCCSPASRVGAVGLGGTNLASASFSTLNVTRCCEACDGLPGCVGWTVNTKLYLNQSGWCFLKAAVTTGSHRATGPQYVASGLKPSPPPPPPAPPVPPPPNAKNILFVPMDDQRPEFAGVFGRPTHTPAMDRLTREGTTFTRAYANFAWCAPSRNSFMSGRRPDTTKAWDFEHHFRQTLPNCTSLPQAFKDAGWWTTGVGKLYHPKLPPQADPPSWSDTEHFPVAGPNSKGSVFGYRDWNHADAGGPQGPEAFDSCDTDIVTLALGRLAVAAGRWSSSGQPFFLGAGLRSVHIPCEC